MLKRLTCFVSGEHHYRMRESGGRVFLECQQCGQRSTGLESSSRPVLAAGHEARPASAPKPSPSISLPKAGADQFLSETLADGPMRQVDVTKAATAQGISDRTLRRARGRLGVVATKHGFGSGSFWVWRLRPGAPAPASLKSDHTGGAEDSRGRRPRSEISQRTDRTS
jgi:hypothetical protein